MYICCLGDSLTEGDYGVFGKSGIADVREKNYPYFLGQLSGATVKNYGRCGITPSGFWNFYQSGEVDVKDADIIIIMLGTNGGLDHENQTDGNRDYLSLVKACRKDAPNAKIVLCTPPHATENPKMSNYGYAENVKKATEVARKVAKEEGLYLSDVNSFSLFCAETEEKYQINDGLHFTEEGYRALAEFIYDSIKNLL